MPRTTSHSMWTENGRNQPNLMTLIPFALCGFLCGMLPAANIPSTFFPLDYRFEEEADMSYLLKPNEAAKRKLLQLPYNRSLNLTLPRAEFFVRRRYISSPMLIDSEVSLTISKNGSPTSVHNGRRRLAPNR